MKGHAGALLPYKETRVTHAAAVFTKFSQFLVFLKFISIYLEALYAQTQTWTVHYFIHIITTSYTVMHAIGKVPNGPLSLVKCYVQTSYMELFVNT